MNDQNRIDQLLKRAKIVTNIAVTVISLSAIVIFQLAVFPNAFNFKRAANTEIAVTEQITDYVPGTGIDAADVKNGIHIPTGLIVDDGIEAVMTTCAACHSIDLVTQNRADREGWKDIIVWMQETQKLWDLGPSEDIILTYLAKNYAPEDTGRRRNLEDIVWYDL